MTGSTGATDEDVGHPTNRLGQDGSTGFQAPFWSGAKTGPKTERVTGSVSTDPRPTGVSGSPNTVGVVNEC